MDINLFPTWRLSPTLSHTFRRMSSLRASAALTAARNLARRWRSFSASSFMRASSSFLRVEGGVRWLGARAGCEGCRAWPSPGGAPPCPPYAAACRGGWLAMDRCGGRRERAVRAVWGQ
eukprot:365867-Chlamydomonas_euryale.AAC.4